MERVDDLLASKFVCKRCKMRGAYAERLAMSGTGLSRLFDLQPHRYVFLSCRNCGYTEVYNLKMLEKKDGLGDFLDVIFSG